MPDEKVSMDALVEFVIVVLEEREIEMPRLFGLVVYRVEFMIALLKPLIMLITS